METKTIATDIADSQLSPPFNELDEVQIKCILYVKDRKKIDTIKEKLGVSERKVYHILDGLLGKKQGVPPKWHCEENYLEKIHRKYSANIHYKLSDLSYQLVSNDIPTKDYKSDEESGYSLPESNKSDQGEKVRPHWLLSKHDIRGSPSGWGDEFQVDENRQVYSEVNHKELPDGGTEEFITTYYDGYEVQLYSETVVVRVDFPESDFRPEVLWRKYRSRVREILSFVEDKFGLELVSRPEHIEACMRGQHWAEVDNMFADWLWSNRDDVGDDREGLQFHVYDEDGDQMALVDASHGDPEFEWVHTQEAKLHMSNMKDLIMWGGYYEITPSDFKSLAWLRQNKDLFENVLDRLQDLDSLQGRLSELEGELDLNREQVEGLTVGIRELRSKTDDLEDSVSTLSLEVEDIGLSVKSHESQISGLSEQMQNNRDEFYQELNSQASRIDHFENVSKDVVERVDYTRQEVEEIDGKVERTKQELSERIEADYELLREEMDGVNQRVTGVIQQNQKLQDNQEDIMQELQMQRKQNAQKMDKLIEEQQKTFVDKVKANMKSMKGVVNSVATALF